MKTLIHVLPGPPAGAPDVPHPEAMWAQLTPGPDTASLAVNHVSNIEYVRWIDQLGQSHLSQMGWTAQTLLDSGAMWFVARHEIDYRLEAKAGETLIAATWVRNMRRVKSWRDVMVWRPKPSGWQLVCTATTLWVYVDLESRRGARPPAEMIASLQPLGDTSPPWAMGVGRQA